MKPLLRQAAVALALAASLCGCTQAAAPRTPFAAASPLTTDPGMISRAVAVPRNPGADLPLVVCVDPSIDVALLFADSVLTGGSRPGLPAGSIAGLTLTSSTSLFGFTPKPRRCGTRCGGCAESGDGRAMDRPLLAN